MTSLVMIRGNVYRKLGIQFRPYNYLSKINLSFGIQSLSKKHFKCIYREYSAFKDHIGQPSYKTHPHLLEEYEISVGMNRNEIELRRLKLLEEFQDGSVVLVFGNRLKFKSNNIFYPFHQNPNMLYLTGFDQPNSALLLIKDESLKKRNKMILFTATKSADAELWEGPKCGIENAKSYFGADEAFDIKDVVKMVKPILNSATAIYLDLPKPLEVNSAEHSITNFLHQQKLNFKVKNLRNYIEAHRLIKSNSEVKMIQKAAEITSKGFKRVMSMKVQESIQYTEHDIASAFEHEIRKFHSQGHAYVPVVANGSNALSLHYVSNDMILKDGNLLMMDAGASYFGYNSDVTRTWPVNGKFTAAQAELYQAVLNVQKKCIEACDIKYRNSLNDILFKSIDWLKEELDSLGFNITRSEVHDKLYPHHVAHYLGLDIHDTPSCTRTQQLRPGMVLTIEPGVYIPKEGSFPEKYRGIGIRIEDNILISEDGKPVNLTQSVPKEINEIELIADRKLI